MGMCGSVYGYPASKILPLLLFSPTIILRYHRSSTMTRKPLFSDILWHLMTFVCRCALTHILIHSFIRASTGPKIDSSPALTAFESSPSYSSFNPEPPSSIIITENSLYDLVRCSWNIKHNGNIDNRHDHSCKCHLQHY